jgi:hypothetical protein
MSEFEDAWACEVADIIARRNGRTSNLGKPGL